VTEAVLEGVRDLSLERPDGRIVAWSEFGDEAGLPLLRVPGTPGCRYSLRADRGPWTQRHLRVITTERPGFGASTRLPGRGFGAPADDLAAVLDHLGLEAVHVMGGSGSAPHQLAFAAQHPDRVRAMTVLVGAAPCTEDEAGQMIGLNADAHGLVQKGDVEGLRRLMEPIRTAMLDDPIVAFRAVMDRAPAADRAVMADPQWQAELAVASTEALRQGVDGWADEAFALASPMGRRGLGRGPDVGDLVARAQGRKRSAVGRTTCGRPSAKRTADHVQRKRRPSRRLSPSGRDTRRATCPRVTLRRPPGKVRHRSPGNLAVKALANPSRSPARLPYLPERRARSGQEPGDTR